MIKADSLPQELSIMDYDDTLASKISIDSVTVKDDPTYSKAGITTVVISGTKVYGNSSISFDSFNYKLYDKDVFVIETSSIYLDNLTEGDKFREEITFYDLDPDNQYTIKFNVSEYCKSIPQHECYGMLFIYSSLPLQQ